MSETGSPDITGAAQRVGKILEDTPSTKVSWEATEQKAKEAMQRTMGELEAARERIGNFCVTVGGGTNMYMQKVIMFPEPVEGPFSDSDPRLALRYVMATKEGFKAVKILFPDPQSADQKEFGWAQKVGDVLKMHLNVAVNSTYERFDQKASGYARDRLVLKTQGTMREGAEVRFYNSPVSGLEDADQQTVEKALHASIERVQAVHQAGLSQATQTLETAQVVQKAVGVPDKASAQSSHRFPFFGKK